MALIDCPECGSEVSDSALKCINCGVQLKKLKRGFFGKLFKYSFILFNLLMVWWLFSAIGIANEAIESSQSGAEQAGAAIGSGIGTFLIMIIWIFGDIVLGLFVMFTKPKG